MIFRLGERRGRHRSPAATRMVAVELESGKRLIGETVLFSVGRVGDTECLNLAAAGLEADERGRLWCDETSPDLACRTSTRVGDVVGFPALASVVDGARSPRRLPQLFDSRFARLPASCRMACSRFPKSRWSARTKQQLTADRVPYEVGIARFREIARGQITGDHDRHAQAAVPPRHAQDCSASTASAKRRPRSSTSARP